MKSDFSRKITRYGRVLALGGLPALAAAAQSDFGASFSVSQGVAAQSMIQSVGDTTNQIVNLVMGPGMFVVMAIGALLALFGWGRGNKESLWTGLVLFILGAVLRGIWSFM
jgi:uncharacterized membrane protein